MQNGNGSAVLIVHNVTAPYIAIDEINQTLYWSGKPASKGKDTLVRIFQASLRDGNKMRNHTTFAIPFSKMDQQNMKKSTEIRTTPPPVKITWLEYDRLGDNIYFVDLNRGICLCSRNSSCTIVVNTSSIGGELSRTTIALDPEKG